MREISDISRCEYLEQCLLEISARERQRIAFDLHDGLGQQLVGIAYKVKLLELDLASMSPALSPKAREIVGLINQTIAQTRNLIGSLAPVEIEKNGLPGALQNLADDIEHVYKVDCRFRSQLKNGALNPQAGNAFYRIALEAIHNSINRGAADHITIDLAATDSNQLCLSVRDNGRGFSTPPNSGTGMGLRIMRYRAQSIGGNLTIYSQVGKGTEIKVKVWVDNEAPGVSRPAPGTPDFSRAVMPIFPKPAIQTMLPWR